MRAFNLKHPLFRVILLQIFLAILLSSCGGDTACEEAIYLAGLVKKVYLIVRRNELRASKVMQERVQKTANIEVLWEHQTKGLFGNNVVEGAILWKKKG